MAKWKRLLVATAAVAAGLTAAGTATSRIAYTSLGTNSHVFVMNGDGSGKRQLTSGAVDDVSPVFSPAGTRLAFVRRRADRSDDLFLVQADGTGLTRLTRTAGSEANPAWSPDGERLAFELGALAGSYEIVAQNVDGSGRKRLTSNRVEDAEPEWSATGTRIAFTRQVGGTNTEIFVMRRDGGQVRRLTFVRAEEHHPDWSSTGKIAFTRYRAAANDLVVMQPDGSGKRRIWSARGIGRATWSPDGSRLAVEVFDGHDSEIYVVSASGATRRRLTNNDFDDFGPVWSTRGARIAYTRFSGRSNDVWVMDRDGSDKRRLTATTLHEAVGDWGP